MTSTESHHEGGVAMLATGRIFPLLAIAATLACGATAASADELENDAGSFTGHVTISLASGTLVYASSSGNVNCSTATGEGTINNENVPNNADTAVGSVESLDFTDGANPECDTNIFGISSCATAVNGLPYNFHVVENGATDELAIFNPNILVGVDVTLTCETFIGDINCRYSAFQLSGTFTGAGREIEQFNDSVGGDPGNSFICPGSLTIQAFLQLRDETGDEVMLTES